MARLTDYSFGRISVDGSEHTRDLIVLPDRVVTDWWRRDGHSLVIDDLDGVLEELPERLVVGIGAYGRLHPDPAAIADLERRGITVECLPTDDASGATASSTSEPPPLPCTSPADRFDRAYRVCHYAERGERRLVSGHCDGSSPGPATVRSTRERKPGHHCSRRVLWLRRTRGAGLTLRCKEEGAVLGISFPKCSLTYRWMGPPVSFTKRILQLERRPQPPMIGD